MKPERTPYEIASIFFAVVVIVFAITGMLVAGIGDGPGSSGFLICGLFLMLGIGRLYLGLRRPGEAPSEEAPEAEPRPSQPRKYRPPPRRRRP